MRCCESDCAQPSIPACRAVPRNRPRPGPACRRPAGRRTPRAARRDRAVRRSRDDRRARRLHVVGRRTLRGRARGRRRRSRSRWPTSCPASRCRRAPRCGSGSRRREAERRALPLWPRRTTEPLGEWVLRTVPAPVGRLLKRANSCLAVGDPGMPLAEAAAGGAGVLRAAAGGTRRCRSRPAPRSRPARRRGLGRVPSRGRAVPRRVAGDGPRAAGSADGVETDVDGTRVLATCDRRRGRGRPRVAASSTTTGWESTGWRSTSRAGDRDWAGG